MPTLLDYGGESCRKLKNQEGDDRMAVKLILGEYELNGTGSETCLKAILVLTSGLYY
jgi:hypothetical protein